MQSSLCLDSFLFEMKGIGPVRASKYEELWGIRTVRDLLLFSPARYKENADVLERELTQELIGERICLEGEIYSTSVMNFGRKRSVLYVRIFFLGQKVCVSFFNQGYRKKQFVLGDKIRVEGKVNYKNGWRLDAPTVFRKDDYVAGFLRPVYPKSEGLPSSLTKSLVTQALPLINELEEDIPIQLLQKANVPNLQESVSILHRPSSYEELATAKRRLALSELLGVQSQRASAQKSNEVNPVRFSYEDQREALSLLPFRLTKDQQEVLHEWIRVLSKGERLQCLLHGEVGSGKTAIVFVLAVLVARKGWQVALLAPTEILARQHLVCFQKWLQSTSIQCSWLDTSAEIVVGTHALLNLNIRFKNLKLVLFDEQQRFGVRQKKDLIEKGSRPHVISMSATPIPRTLAWSYFGSLRPYFLSERIGKDIPIHTRVFLKEEWNDQAKKIIPFLEKGEQLFVVVPRIEGEDGVELLAQEMSKTLWSQFSFRIIHGRLENNIIHSAIDDFKSKRVSILFCTTILEVGVDLPAINHMMVYGADRLGLSSLHQLRGRLARGLESKEGFCQFFSDNKDSVERLSVLEKYQSGFEVAAADLRHRGPGELLGTEQHGRGFFQYFDPLRDEDLINLLAEFEDN